ncbi:hypothetical protein ROA7450_04027 [Roseovarius albus]|uniref:Uncharacterized protein n=1 Tax=Roseovarius albus TaxID=1247867 RepID=A0A1X7A9P5_9RHOB|nr:hypothetical protein [Roseovarius albus]SLN72321.1 hypothetical protein ROA7450_04027 [Roseovarius albus]
MQIEKLHLDDVRYNPELSGFEALVRIHEDGAVYSYPCQVNAPLHADFKIISRRLTQKAKTAHKAPSPILRLRRDLRDLSDAPQSSPVIQQLRRLIAA